MVAEVRAEGAVRSVYHDQQLKVYRAEKNWTQHEEMQLQEIIEEEVSKIIELYRLSAEGADMHSMSDEDLLDLIDYVWGEEPLQ